MSNDQPNSSNPPPTPAQSDTSNTHGQTHQQSSSPAVVNGDNAPNNTPHDQSDAMNLDALLRELTDEEREEYRKAYEALSRE